MSKSRSKMKIGLKQILSGILTLMLVFTSVPFAGFTTFAATPVTHLVDGTTGTKTSQDLIDTIKDASDGDIIVINGTVTIDKYVKISDKSITLKKGNEDAILFRDQSYTGNILGIYGKSNVTMDDIIIDGNKDNFNEGTGSAVDINKGASLTMNGGTIKNNNASYIGGGVYNGGHFEMNGGEIKNNTATDEYGGGVFNEGIFKMYKGTISGNNAIAGGGVYNYNRIFEMNGGTISNNTAKYDGGGGVYSTGTFTIENGTISDNKAEKGNGGGVLYSTGTFTMENGTISGNKAEKGDGGGVWSFSFIMNKGTISGNTAVNGGGVCSPSFIMNKGTISGNTATANGGGVYNYGTITMNGGTISGNAATANGGGLYIDENTLFDVQGEATITNNGKDNKNNNVGFASADKYIRVVGKLSGLIGVKQDFDKIAVKAAGGYNLTPDDAKCFSADDVDSHLELVDDTLVYRVGTVSWNLQSKVNNAADGDTIVIDNTINIDNTVEINKNITLKGSGTLLRAEGFKDKMLNISPNANVTIEGITIDGNKDKVTDSTGSAVYINKDASLTMNSGTIKNNNADNGGGVYNAGTLKMTGGTIGENIADNGGGVYVGNGGNLRVQGEATITNNGKDKNNNVRFASADDYITVLGKFSGSIGVKQEFDKVAVKAVSGYILTQDDVNHFFTDDLNDHWGFIDNTLVYIAGRSSNHIQNIINNAADGDTITIDDIISIDKTVEINKNITLKGNGTLIRAQYFKDKMLDIAPNANVIMEEITIDGNNVADSLEPAVYINSGASLTMNSGAIINNHTYFDGGGVYNRGGTFTINQGTIKNNTAENGGGVYNVGTFKMVGGTISENTVEKEGGGVYNRGGTFNMTGGTISKNTAEKLGGGLYLNKGTFKVQDTAIINDNAKNDNVRVESSDFPIIVSGGYNGVIRVNSNFGNVVVKAADGYSITKNDMDCFAADDSNAHLEYLDGKLIYTKNQTEWGQMVQSNGVTYYVDENGRVSAEVVGNGKIWLNTKSDGSGSWYCIDNSQGTFKIGSRFYIQVIDDISKYYDKIGSEYRDKIEDGKLKIFLIGVTDPNGKEYTNLDTEINCYVKVNPNWDKDKIKAIFINGEKSEKVDIEYMGTLDGPSNGDKFIRLTLKHFSPYAIYQAKSEDNALGNTFATGENVNYGYILGLSTMAIAALAGVMFIKRKFNK